MPCCGDITVKSLNENYLIRVFYIVLHLVECEYPQMGTDKMRGEG